MSSPKIYTDHQICSAQMVQLAEKEEDVFLLDSCQISDAMNLGQYQVILAKGISKQYRVETLDVVNWETVQQFSDGKNWCFCLMSYDLKNQLCHLTSQNPSTLNWPELVMVIPETVIALNKLGELMIWSDDPGSIYKSLHFDQQSIKAPTKVEFKEIKNSMTKSEYLTKVEYIKDQITNGDVYEMNLCMEYVLENFYISEPIQLFEKLVTNSPSPFSAYIKLKNMHILCASPERFITKIKNHIYSQPIKGTSPRFADVNKDELSKKKLNESIKERAEHVMIVDLVRNDLSKCAKPGTTQVPELFEIYGFAHVFQMISTIQSELLESVDFQQIVKNTFPMGSMTGAPKISAMEYIDQLENVSRGIYSGSIGYIQPGGNFDFNVVIRSLLYDSDKSIGSFSVGGAITFDSDPVSEFEECQLKAVGIRRTLGID